MSRANRQRRYRARHAALTLPVYERARRWALRCPGFAAPTRVFEGARIEGFRTLAPPDAWHNHYSKGTT